MWQRKDYTGVERRQYIRLDSVFPVQFRLLSLDGKSFLSEPLQGFTDNIGKGGLCLSVNNLHPELAKLIKENQAKLSLEIDIPVVKKPIAALTRAIWIKEAIGGEANRYIIGLNYEQIDTPLRNRMMHYIRAKKIFVPAVLSIIFILIFAFALNSYINVKLVKGNKALVEQLVKILQESSIAKQKVKQIYKEREDLQLKIQALQTRIQMVEEEKGKMESAQSEEIKKLGSLIEKLSKEKESLEKELINVYHEENNVTEDLLHLDRKKSTLQKANIDKMYHWLKVHQNPHTGLVMSFEGDDDVRNWAFIYDQALAIQAYTNFSDFQYVRKILDFFEKKAKRIDRLFFNAYYTNDMGPAEAIIHSGPNIWLGIAILHYTSKAEDSRYLKLAEEIAEAIIELQNKDPEAGIPGGPNLTWHASEHNLDAYAFFNMLYQITAKPRYLQARDKVLDWLVEHTYDKRDIPVKRGKGDSCIATDTYAWSIAAIGPEKLEELEMNPDRIIEFAEENCLVEVSYKRPEGAVVKVKGFDFAPKEHLARGGVVSSEWTAQMVLALKIMSDFYYKKSMIAKARAYELKADEYMTQLGNMVISSPSPSGQGESCLPYTTQDSVDTGHGWVTPKGSCTGSVSGTVYTIFAYYNYNPLELKE